MAEYRRSWRTKLGIVVLAVACGLVAFAAVMLTVGTRNSATTASCAMSSGNRDVTVGREATIIFGIGERDSCDDGVHVPAPPGLADDQILFDAQLESLSNDVEVRPDADNGPQPGSQDRSWSWSVTAEKPGTHDLVVVVHTFDRESHPLQQRIPKTSIVLTARGTESPSWLGGLFGADGTITAMAGTVAGLVSAIVSVLALRRTSPRTRAPTPTGPGRSDSWSDAAGVKSWPATHPKPEPDSAADPKRHG